METMHVIMLEINREYHLQVKNTYYSRMYLTCILHYWNKFNFTNFSFFFTS
jgi:hypothetical protein